MKGADIGAGGIMVLLAAAGMGARSPIVIGIDPGRDELLDRLDTLDFMLGERETRVKPIQLSGIAAHVSQPKPLSKRAKRRLRGKLSGMSS